MILTVVLKFLMIRFTNASVEREPSCAQKSGISFDVVLFDTWFSNPAQLVALKEINANVIAMIKKKLD